MTRFNPVYSSRNSTVYGPQDRKRKRGDRDRKQDGNIPGDRSRKFAHIELCSRIGDTERNGDIVDNRIRRLFNGYIVPLRQECRELCNKIKKDDITFDEAINLLIVIIRSISLLLMLLLVKKSSESTKFMEN